MKKKFSSIIKSAVVVTFVLVLISLLSGCMNMKHGMKTDMTDRGIGVVWMKHDNFSPGNITVPVNTTVTWTNKDLWAHTITSDAGFFDSGKIKRKGTFSYQFTATGIYTYHCKIHNGMVGKVIVQ